jgi:hypothetical protein
MTHTAAAGGTAQRQEEREHGVWVPKLGARPREIGDLQAGR